MPPAIALVPSSLACETAVTVTAIRENENESEEGRAEGEGLATVKMPADCRSLLFVGFVGMM